VPQCTDLFFAIAFDYINAGSILFARGLGRIIMNNTL